MSEEQRNLAFELTGLWLKYLADLGTSAQKEATFEGFMDWLTGRLTNNA